MRIMKQTVGKNIANLDRNELNRLVTVNFLDSIQQVVESHIFDAAGNEKEFAKLITTEQSKISKLKTDENRYVTLDILAKAVNVLGMDANAWFVADNSKKKKKLIRDGVHIDSKVIGNNNQVTTGKNNTVIHGSHTGDIYNAESIIQSMSEKDQKEMKKYMDGVSNEIIILKKTVDHYKTELKIKDEKLMETQEKYINLLESLQKVKK